MAPSKRAKTAKLSQLTLTPTHPTESLTKFEYPSRKTAEDSVIIDLLTRILCLNGPYINAKPVCWKNKEQKDRMRHEWENVANSVTFGDFVRSMLNGKNAYMAWF